MINFISTPIGNLNDISLRAIDVIRKSDYLYAEDTRKVKKLLKSINCEIKCKSFYEHNEDKVSLKIIEDAKNNKIVSIVSDAGTPAISDPGYKLIRRCIDKNIKYTLIPGPSSVISGLVMSGLPTDQFSFFGFIPKKINDQAKCFENLKYEKKTAIFFESPKRLEKTILNLINFLSPDRKISICKEMTKLHEEVIIDKLLNILDKIKQSNFYIKGEIVIVIEGVKNKKNNLKIDNHIKKEFLKRLSASESAKLISSITGENKRDIYKSLIEN